MCPLLDTCHHLTMSNVLNALDLNQVLQWHYDKYFEKHKPHPNLTWQHWMKINVINELSLSLSSSHLKPKDMFAWVDFIGYGKKWREKWRENDSFVCLVRRERGRENWWGPWVFSPTPPKSNLSKMERKESWRSKDYFAPITLLPHSAHCSATFALYCSNLLFSLSNINVTMASRKKATTTFFFHACLLFNISVTAAWDSSSFLIYYFNQFNKSHLLFIKIYRWRKKLK